MKKLKIKSGRYQWIKCVVVIVVASCLVLSLSACKNKEQDFEVVKDRYSLTGGYTYHYVGKETEVTIPQTCAGYTIRILTGIFDEDSPVEKVTVPATVEQTSGSFSNMEKLEEVVFEEDSKLRIFGEYTFFRCSSLKRIIIPDGVETIKGHAFDQCTSLEEIVIPDSVTLIEANAFYGCTSLKSVIGGKNVTQIEERAFAYCTSLTRADVLKTATSFGQRAFTFCTALQEAEVGAAINVYFGMFEHCTSLRKVILGDAVKTVEDCAFLGCENLQSVDGGQKLIKIGASAFDSCGKLQSISLPEGLTEIGDLAFRWCDDLQSVVIPLSCEKMGEYVFANCTSLTVYVRATEQSVKDNANWGENWAVNRTVQYEYVD